MTDRSRLAGTLALAAVVLGTGACSGDPEPEKSVDLPSSTETASGSASASGSSSASAGVPEPSAPPRNGERVRDDGSRSYALTVPDNEPARTVAQTLVDYSDVRTQAFADVEVDLAELSRVAMGDPLNQVQAYTSELEQRENHVVGNSWFKIPGKAVRVEGNTATIAAPACVLNASAEVSEQGVAEESPPSAYRVEAKLLKAGPEVWVVTEFSAEPANDC